MSDFVTLAQTFGLPLAMTITASVILARVIVVVSREKDRINESRYNDMKAQFEARITEITEDRDWNRDRLYQVLGLSDAGTAALEEVVRKIAKQLPPRTR